MSVGVVGRKRGVEERTWIFKSPSAMLEMNDRHRVADDPASMPSLPCAALEILGVQAVHVHVQPVVVVEVAVVVARHRAGEVLARVVQIGGRVEDADGGWG